MERKDVIPLKCALMRCGTSKGVFIHENQLPRDPELRRRVVLAVFGSPDKRQIDGLGGAEPLTSKVAVIGPPSREDADVDYTFGQVEIEKPVVYFTGLCGNISSGVGTFAIEEGLVRATEPVTKVRVHSVNTKQVYVAEVPVKDGFPAVAGDYRIDGVPGSGAEVTMDMAGTVASFRKGLFPTGNKKDKLEIPGFGCVTVSIVDVVNPVAFVHARDLGLKGHEITKDIPAETYAFIERIRAKIALLLGIEGWDDNDAKDPLPFLVFVSEAKDCVNHLTGETIRAQDSDYLARAIFLGGVHQTFPGAVSCATGCAAKLSGTVVYEVSKNSVEGVSLLGHPAGVLRVEVEVGLDERGCDTVTRVTYGRTARRIMDGTVYVPANLPE